MEKLKVYRCNICGNLICVSEKTKIIPECCLRAMKQVDTGGFDAGEEYSVESGRMDRLEKMARNSERDASGKTQLIILFTDGRIYGKKMRSDDFMFAEFRIEPGEKLLSAYAFSDVVGLWRKTG